MEAQNKSDIFDYDYPVAVEDGRNLRIQWNHDDNEQEVSLAFANKYDIPSDELPSIYEFVQRIARTQSARGGTRESTPTPASTEWCIEELPPDQESREPTWLATMTEEEQLACYLREQEEHDTDNAAQSLSLSQQEHSDRMWTEFHVDGEVPTTCCNDAAATRFWAPWWPVPPAGSREREEQDDGYFLQTRMANRSGEALLVDIGAHDDLCSDAWVRGMQESANAAGVTLPTFEPLASTITVGGVGKGADEARTSATVTIGIQGEHETYQAPMLEHSNIPALLGIKSLKQRRSVIDTFTNKMYTVGVGGYRIQLSPGSKTYQLEESTGGHLMLPCTDYHPTTQYAVSTASSAAGSQSYGPASMPTSARSAASSPRIPPPTPLPPWLRKSQPTQQAPVTQPPSPYSSPGGGTSSH